MSQIEGTSTSAGDDRCTEWLKEWESWPSPYYCQLPLNRDGQPIWEPPIFNYSPLIGEEYEKKRKAMLEYTGGDVARTTDIMDAYTEIWLLVEYSDWAEDNAKSAVDSESKKFFEGLSEEVGRDGDVVDREFQSFDGGLFYRKNEDGTYYVYAPYAEDEVNADDVSDNSSNGCPPTVSHNGTNSQNNLDICRNQSYLQHNRISSPTDEEELAWLDSLDSSASTYSPLSPNPAQPRGTTPLALRIISLHSKTTFHDSQLKQREVNEGDDVD